MPNHQTETSKPNRPKNLLDPNTETTEPHAMRSLRVWQELRARSGIRVGDNNDAGAEKISDLGSIRVYVVVLFSPVGCGTFLEEWLPHFGGGTLRLLIPRPVAERLDRGDEVPGQDEQEERECHSWGRMAFVSSEDRT